MVVSFPDPPPKRKGGSGEYSLHVLIFATQRVGVFISESDGCICRTVSGVIDWKGTDGSADDVSHCTFSGKRLRPVS